MIQYDQTKEHFPVRNLKIAGELMQLGFICFEVRRNHEQQKNIYLFKNTPQIIEKFNQLLYIKSN